MKNYYAVLGVRENASKEEIRNAYRELVKKYHPDKYQNNPLSDLAEEKLKEINEAYDYLSNQGSQTRQQSGGFRQQSSQSYRTPDEEGFQRVRQLIQAGNLETAAALLQTLDRTHPDFHYLSGLIALQRGWYQEAAMSIQTAMRMNPANREYQAAWQRMNLSNQQYQAAGRQRGYQGNNDLCQLCTCLYCTDCCCECGGGNLIDCC